MVSAAQFLWPVAWQTYRCERVCVCVCVSVWKGCSTHVQVWWDVCRVHGLSLSSSVTIPRLSLPLLLDRMDKVDYFTSYSLSLLSQGNQCLSLPCLLRKWTVGNAALSMFSSPLCSLAQLLILLSVSDKQTLKNIHRLPLCLPACLPDLCSWATPFLCRLHFHPCLFETHWDRRCALKLQEEKWVVSVCLSVCTVSSATTPSCS